MPLNDDITLAALFAGYSIGIGLGIIFRLVVQPGVSILLLDSLINMLAGAWEKRCLCLMLVLLPFLIFYLSYQEAMYTLVAVFIAARVIDFMQEGAYSARGAMIISEQK